MQTRIKVQSQGKEKKGEEDGMNLKDNIGRNARPIGVLACPPYLTSY